MSERGHGVSPVVAALVGNTALTLIKGVVALSSGSSAMFSEAVHSFADTINQALLLVGLRRSRKKPDEEFGYGYGSERFFWALISACGIFFVGAGVTIFHGITSLEHAQTVSLGVEVFGVLIVAFFVESWTLLVAWRSLVAAHPDRSWRERIDRADPTTLAVLLEDGIAVLGVVVAAIAITLSYVTGNTLWDAWGSITVGFLLAFAAVALIIKNRAYLIGRSIPEAEKEAILALLSKEAAIERVIDFKSTVLDIGVYRIKCEIEFNGFALLDAAHQLDELRSDYEKVRDDYEAFKKFYVDYADRIPRLIGQRIDEIEARICAAFPEVRYVDIEIN